MTNYREILRLRSLGINHSRIAEGMGIARQTVVTAIQRAAAQNLDWATVEGMSDRELAAAMRPGGGGQVVYKQPDYVAIHKEMAKPGMTQQLLWMEYCDTCRAAGDIPYGLTQFKTHYREYLTETKATMHINRKPGDIMEVDWAGQTAHIIDTDTGDLLPAYVFVAVLPYSGYAYAEAFWKQNQASWSAAHVNAYAHFGGVARMLVPDNLKTGVTKHTRQEVVLNKAYQELAEHYGTAILPTRVRAPKDKATVEGTVGNLSTFILAAIRNGQFFSLRELNEAIWERLKIFNHKPFQKKDGSRATWFLEEREFLLPLPMAAFELAEWSIAKVGFNYHISVDEHYYSVPYEYIRKQVDIRLTRGVVEVFYENLRICSHVRSYDRRDRYLSKPEHMPDNHKQYLEWNGDRFRRWAAKIGPNAVTVVESILTGCKVEQQGYKGCMALLKLADTYTPERLESACAKALDYTPRPGYKTIQTILRTGQDRIAAEVAAPTSTDDADFGFTRGADYYGKGAK